MLASIPSPSAGVLELGPFNLRLYGLIIAIAVVVVVLLYRRRLTQRGLDPDGAVTMAWAVVPAGLVGARLYHVVTDWKLYQDNWLEAFEIWQGGLGIPGGIAGGVLAAIFVCRKMGWSLRQQMDIGAPLLPLGQAIGRLGNWFNQELFGRPTDLPWGLEIDLEHVPAQYQAEAAVSELTFHPTFLYEGLWNLGLMGVLLWLDSKRKLPTGHIFACYVLGYATGRLWIELLRIDTASELAGVRVNVWIMAALWLGAAAWLVFRRNDPKLPEDAAAGADSGVADGAAVGADSGVADGAADGAAGDGGTDGTAEPASNIPFDDAAESAAGAAEPASSAPVDDAADLDPQDIPGGNPQAAASPAAGAGSASGSVRLVQPPPTAAAPASEQPDSEQPDSEQPDSEQPDSEPAK